jgi:hypothetical protein
MLGHFTKAYEKEHGGNMIIFEFDNRADAGVFVDHLNEIISAYGCASLADAYDLRGVTSHYADNSYIWYKKFDENEVISRVGDTLAVKLPDPIKSEDIPIMPVDENYMSPDTFKQLLEELDANSVKTLAEKNARYSGGGDALHNFRAGADIFGGTPAQACWGYLTKHLVALRDMVMRDDFSNREDLLEKCQDSINYIRFLWCIGNDKNNKKEND